MKKWGNCLFSILLSALVIGASADVAFALPKKLPKLKGGKRPRITVPKTPSTRNLPPTSGVRPNVATQVERATANAAKQTAKQAAAAPAVTPVKAPKVATPTVTPKITPVQDTGTNLTGMQVLAHYYPTWRQELGGMFSNEQLDAVEKAFADTDEWMFVRGEDGELKARNKEEWDYEARFLTILQNSGVSFTERQIKHLVGGRGSRGKTLNVLFVRMNGTGFALTRRTSPRMAIYKDGKKISSAQMTEKELQEFQLGVKLITLREHPAIEAFRASNRRVEPGRTVEDYLRLAQQYQNRPRPAIYKDGKILSREEMTEEEWQEVQVGRGLQSNNKDPRVQAYFSQTRILAESKTPEEYVRLAESYPVKPRPNIYRNGRRLSREEMTEAEIQETNIGQGLNNYRNHPLVQAYMNKHRRIAVRQGPEAYVAMARQYTDKPRAAILRNGRPLTREEMTEQEKKERTIGRGLSRFRNHPLVQEYMAENRRFAAAKTSQQIYEELLQHIKGAKQWPTYHESHLAFNIYSRLKYHQSTMTTDGKYADPWLQKIYELKQWSERVKRGEVDWDKFPGLFKKHRRTIGEIMREQGQLPPKETPKELEQLSAEEQQAIEQMADNLLTLWEDFEGVWWKQNYKHVITTPQTQVAFNTVLKTVQTQVPGASNVNISNVLEQVNGMQLGQDGPDYYRVIYRGNNPHIPRAEDFHNVEEITGLPQQYAQPAYKLNAQHISLDGDDEMVYNMFLTDGVTDKEMAAVIDALTPAGWEIRLGAHELLSEIKQGKVHIHIEQVVPTTEEDAQDISHVLRVDLRPLTRGKNPQQVAKTLRYLFAKYLKDDGHQALNNIQKAF